MSIELDDLIRDLETHGMPEGLERNINYNAVRALFDAFTPAQARAVAFAILNLLET